MKTEVTKCDRCGDIISGNDVFRIEKLEFTRHGITGILENQDLCGMTCFMGKINGKVIENRK